MFIKIYQNVLNEFYNLFKGEINNLNIREILSTTLFKYLKQLKENEFDSMSQEIILKFAEYKNEERTNKLKKLILNKDKFEFKQMCKNFYNWNYISKNGLQAFADSRAFSKAENYLNKHLLSFSGYKSSLNSK